MALSAKVRAPLEDGLFRPCHRQIIWAGHRTFEIGAKLTRRLGNLMGPQRSRLPVALAVNKAAPCATAAAPGRPAPPTMYSAYQSDQFASRSPPVRFSCSPCAAPARRSAVARSADEVKVVSCASTRPGNRAVTSCNSQLLPSGSLNVAYEK